MRIIAGVYRRRILKTLRGHELRPTSDRLRETLFDVLGSAVENSIFIDAYAGSGAVGLEALSRGARHAVFIEENPAAARIIQENLASLSAGENADVIRAPARKALRLLEERGLRSDFCFLDPPYAASLEYERSLRWLSEHHLMSPMGLIILQHARREALPERVGRCVRTRLLPQGSSALSFYKFASE